MEEEMSPMDVQTLMDDPTHPFGNKCNVCHSDFEDTNLMGWIGILPVSLCENCAGGLYSLVYATSSIAELEEIIERKRMEDAAQDY